MNPQAIGEKVRNRLEQITKTVDNLYQLRVEKEYLESQAKAWKEAARQVQVQLKSLKSKGSLVKINLSVGNPKSCLVNEGLEREIL